MVAVTELAGHKRPALVSAAPSLSTWRPPSKRSTTSTSTVRRASATQHRQQRFVHHLFSFFKTTPRRISSLRPITLLPPTPTAPATRLRRYHHSPRTVQTCSCHCPTHPPLSPTAPPRTEYDKKGFITYFKSLPEDAKAIRFFDRKDFYSVHGRGLHSSTSQLNLTALHGSGGVRRGFVARVKGVFRVCRVFSCVRHGSS